MYSVIKYLFCTKRVTGRRFFILEKHNSVNESELLLNSCICNCNNSAIVPVIRSQPVLQSNTAFSFSYCTFSEKQLDNGNSSTQAKIVACKYIRLRSYHCKLQDEEQGFVSDCWSYMLRNYLRVRLYSGIGRMRTCRHVLSSYNVDVTNIA